MVGIVVVGTMCHHDVRLPIANESGHCLAILERGHQFAIVIIEHDRFGKP